MPAIVVPTSGSSSWAGTTTATRLPASTALRASARGDRRPCERRGEPEQEAEECRDDDVVSPAPRRRLHRGRVREDVRQLDLLHLPQRELRAQLVLDVLAEAEDPDPGVGTAAAPDRGDLPLVERDAPLPERDLPRRGPSCRCD